MLANEEIKHIFEQITDVSFVSVEGDGYHYQLTLVSPLFQGMSLVKRQQWVYAKINHLILSGTVHALTMKTWTKEEWESQHG